MDRQTLSPFDTIELINLFLEKYNTKNLQNGSMFEGSDIKNMTSTNDKMEMFYEYMQEYNDLIAENREYIDVYPPEVNITTDTHDVYAIMDVKNNKILYISKSYISLLYTAYKTFRRNDDDKYMFQNVDSWNIVKL